jgi:hypothetical protein
METPIGMIRQLPKYSRIGFPKSIWQPTSAKSASAFHAFSSG